LGATGIGDEDVATLAEAGCPNQGGTEERDAETLAGVAVTKVIGLKSISLETHDGKT
jgi:hypothetical protein